MIFGIFGGVTPGSVEAKIGRLTALKVEIHTDISKGLADRAAAIAELQKEVQELAEMKRSL